MQGRARGGAPAGVPAIVRRCPAHVRPRYATWSQHRGCTRPVRLRWQIRLRTFASTFARCRAVRRCGRRRDFPERNPGRGEIAEPLELHRHVGVGSNSGWPASQPVRISSESGLRSAAKFASGVALRNSW
jgi:hypothetical protein